MAREETLPTNTMLQHTTKDTGWQKTAHVESVNSAGSVRFSRRPVAPIIAIIATAAITIMFSSRS